MLSISMTLLFVDHDLTTTKLKRGGFHKRRWGLKIVFGCFFGEGFFGEGFFGEGFFEGFLLEGGFLVIVGELRRYLVLRRISLRS